MTRTEIKPAVSAVKELLAQEPDALREIVRSVMQAMLEAEMDEALGAGKSERSDARLGYRSGHYPRTLGTRVGRRGLRVRQARPGGFPTEWSGRYQRSAQAWGGRRAETYVRGVRSKKNTAEFQSQ